MNPDLYRLVETVRRTGEEHTLWSPGDCIVVAVSGGPDSVILLHILQELSRDPELGLKLVCAHVNHGFRGKESDEEAEFVRGLAQRLEIPFELGVFDIPTYMKETGKGGQLAAREKRYAFLHKVAAQYGASAIALAHHADDQAETVMMRILRGSGPSGLAGMKLKRREKNVELIRPLLRIYKNELVQACDRSSIPYVIDSSNLVPKYARNAIRLDVLPFLGQYNGQLADSLNRLAEVIGEEDDYMCLETERLYAEMVTWQNGGAAFQLRGFTSLHAALQRRLIKLILNYLSAGSEITDFHKIEWIRQTMIQNKSTTWSLDIGGGLACIREYDKIWFMHKPQEQSKSYTYELQAAVPELFIPEIGKRMTMKAQSPHDPFFQAKGEACAEAVFDADQLKFPLTLRSRLPGDTMKVMGLNGSKKVKDIFIDAKIPPSARSRIPVLVDGSGNIIWIPGVRRSAHAAVGARTISVLHMCLEDAEAVEQL